MSNAKQDNRPVKVVVLCGGTSPERDVSLNSGREVLTALTEAGFEAASVDLLSPDDAAEATSGFDVAFVALHGGWGEDGVLQMGLERLGVPYTGSGPEACAIAMDKSLALERFARAGLAIPKGILLSRLDSESDRENFATVTGKLGRDLVVKPCGGGSTVGVTILHDATELDFIKAVATARESYKGEQDIASGEVLVEKYIAGRELTAAVLEREGQTVALPVIEIAPHAGFYDYANKYTKGATEYLVPAPIPDEITRKVQEAAVTAHKCLGCRMYSRTDFRLAPDGTAYILEVNTAPGMTATSLVPKAARAAGISFPELVSMLVRAARA